jgi:hypothetical protein
MTSIIRFKWSVWEEQKKELESTMEVDSIVVEVATKST